MITGDQIRQARTLLGWPSSRLAQRAKEHSAIVRRAESVDGQPPITVYQASRSRWIGPAAPMPNSSLGSPSVFAQPSAHRSRSGQRHSDWSSARSPVPDPSRRRANEAAITRLVGAILLKQNDEWAVQRARLENGVALLREGVVSLFAHWRILLVELVPGVTPIPAG